MSAHAKKDIYPGNIKIPPNGGIYYYDVIATSGRCALNELAQCAHHKINHLIRGIILCNIHIMKNYDVVIVGAGAAGLFAAHAAILNGRTVAVLDMGATAARKVATSGGGRCNITNAAAGFERYFGENPDFVRGAIARITPNDILEWMASHNLRWVEKAAGQYFCATGADDVVQSLLMSARDADIMYNQTVNDISKTSTGFITTTNNKTIQSQSVIIASGGTSFATLGVSDIGFKIAKKFGHKIVPVRPALCAIQTNAFPHEFAGISVMAEIKIGRDRITDSLLFTHFGIGGPATYRATVRNADVDWHINLMPGINVTDFLTSARTTTPRQNMTTVLGTTLPARIAKWIVGGTDKNIADYSNREIEQISKKITDIVITKDDIKYHGMPSAEVVRGGIDTSNVSSKTMESKLCKGLYFAGEVLDIAGDLGGFNLHWAWASGMVAGQNA